jgi:cytochrome d ubiquinol oxidase subunit II
MMPLASTVVEISRWQFGTTSVATIFTGLYPRVLVSHPVFANSLTVSNAAAGHYLLKVITIVAAIFVPLMLLYQGWTYYVFRKRLSGESPATPLASLRGGTASPHG